MGVISVNKEASNYTEPSPVKLRRSLRLQEKCVTGLSSSSLCGLSSDANVQHVPFSYSVPCPALDLPVEGGQTRRNLMTSKRWQSCTEVTPERIPLTGQIHWSPCSIFSGQVLQEGLLPSELSHLSVPPSSSVAFRRPRHDKDVGKIRSVCSRPLVPSAPGLMSPPLPLPGPVSLPPLPPLSPDQTGSGRPLDGRVFPYHTVLDPVGFQGFRTPSSRYYYTTGTFPGVDTHPAGRPLKCQPSRPSHTMLAPPMEQCPGA